MKQLPLYFLTFFISISVPAQDAVRPILIEPYLQYATQNSIRILWETSDSCTSFITYGPAQFNTNSSSLSLRKILDGKNIMHHIELTGLQPETHYMYRAFSVLPGGDTLASPVSTFQTAIKDSTAFAFTVFSDSQFDPADPGAWGRVSTQAWKERPNFALHAGDLVDLGYRKDDWVNEFFAPASTLMKRIPIYSIPGNHEHDAALYYRYMYVPQPYYYSFRYGNAEIFMLDTNQYQEEGTDMYNWLEQALARSTAYWKFVVHHHPPYSSDEDDFGDTNVEASTLGDKEARGLTSLYDTYGVDIVFYGHIHTYERSWPVLQNKTVNENGVIYLNVGGAGGRLENPSPIRSWFTNKLSTIHHFGYVAINDNTLQFRAIDENGALFDSFSLTGSRKSKMPAHYTPAAPVATNERKIFADTIQVQLQAALPGEAIRYTSDNSEPGKNSPLYKQKIVLDKTTTLKVASFNKSGKSRVNTIPFTKEKAYAAVTVTSPQQGLYYHYFTGKINDSDTAKFKDITFSKTGITTGLDFTQIPHRRQYWGAVYKGYIKVPTDGYYHFSGHADHILRLQIHDKMLFEELDREINYKGDIYLKAGYHPVKIAYYNSRLDRAFLELYYSGPGIERQAAPSEIWWREGDL
ncbi:MAG TPA: metallophosphoesterase [Flavipsychrobacter sp.]|uniref:metallophosphoesterase n=1 Tax=Agriterribacter sp. TaxID=2821509 RepID=UPI002B9AFC95|nr:metallophosphoesterase [Agriterribacter sp.]HTN09161.1 metallophosphoesterase [Agriterribacter sp.]HTN47788.1 metallophosphoesterase [Flavipsychrobacter sp.]